MRFRGRRTATRIAGWTRSLFRPGPLILGYHRVAESNWDPQHLCVKAENFAEQLEVIGRVAQPCSLQRLLRALKEGNSLRRAIVVTFDDGYADTVDAAAPLLLRNDIPATVFITTAMIGKPFWWCEIQRVVENSRELPEKVQLRIGSKLFQWVRGGNTSRTRARLIKRLCDFFRSLSFHQQGKALTSLRAVFDSVKASGSPALAMTAEQIASLADSNLVEIGSHTVTHAPLGSMGSEDQHTELRQSKAELENISGQRIVSFSYPNGAVSAEAPGIAEDLGFLCGCTTREAVVASTCNPYLLPRLLVRDWNGEQFSRWLWWWLR